MTDACSDRPSATTRRPRDELPGRRGQPKEQYSGGTLLVAAYAASGSSSSRGSPSSGASRARSTRASTTSSACIDKAAAKAEAKKASAMMGTPGPEHFIFIPGSCSSGSSSGTSSARGPRRPRSRRSAARRSARESKACGTVVASSRDRGERAAVERCHVRLRAHRRAARPHRDRPALRARAHHPHRARSATASRKFPQERLRGGARHRPREPDAARPSTAAPGLSDVDSSFITEELAYGCSRHPDEHDGQHAGPHAHQARRAPTSRRRSTSAGS